MMPMSEPIPDIALQPVSTFKPSNRINVVFAQSASRTSTTNLRRLNARAGSRPATSSFGAPMPEFRRSRLRIGMPCSNPVAAITRSGRSGTASCGTSINFIAILSSSATHRRTATSSRIAPRKSPSALPPDAPLFHQVHRSRRS